MGGTDEDRGPRRVMRGLGVRHLLQAVAESRFDGTGRKIGIGVDAIHAATDIGFARFDQRWRRPAASDAAITTGFVLLGLIDTGPRHITNRSLRITFHTYE
jgi:hypothetical protein